MNLTSFTAYFIPSLAISLTSYLYYLLALRNKRVHSFNRFYLVTSVVASVLLPLIDLSWIWPQTEMNLSGWAVGNRVAGDDRASWVFFGAIIYFCVSVLLLLMLGVKIAWIYRMKAIHKHTRQEGYVFIDTELGQAPFSFGKNIFWRRDLSLEDANGLRIFRHELAHVRQGHTYDRLLMQVLSSLFWINPFFWLLQNELATVHEFIADEQALENGDGEAFAHMLLYAHDQGAYLSPSHRFFNSQIKRRLIMISSTKSTKYPGMRKLLVIPVAVAIIAALSLTSQAQNGNASQSSGRASADTTPVQTPEIVVQGYPTRKSAKPKPSTKKPQDPIEVPGKPLEKKAETKPESKKTF